MWLGGTPSGIWKFNPIAATDMSFTVLIPSKTFSELVAVGQGEPQEVLKPCLSVAVP